MDDSSCANGTPLQYSCLENPMDGEAWWAAVHGVEKSWTRVSDFTLTFHFHALEKDMATHSSVLAWRIPGTGEPDWLPSMGSHRVRHDWSDLAAAAAWDRNYHPCVERRELKLGRLSNLPSISCLLLLFSYYSLRPHGLQYTKLPCCSLSPRVFSNSCPLSRWCHPTILSSVTPFSSCPQSFPASGSFPVSQL